MFIYGDLLYVYQMLMRIIPREMEQFMRNKYINFKDLWSFVFPYMFDKLLHILLCVQVNIIKCSDFIFQEFNF